MRFENAPVQLWSIGHSTLELPAFVELLKLHNISAIADVRSVPFSKRAPWFSRDDLKQELASVGIAYSFLGAELGGRPKSANLMKDGVADYRAMAKTPSFELGLSRLTKGAQQYRIAMMCSEGDPLHCHRCLLVARALAERSIDTHHILRSGIAENQEIVEERLLREERLDALDFLTPNDRRLEEAYARRARQFAYSPQRGNTQATAYNDL